MMITDVTIPMPHGIREADLYRGRNTSMGALIDESERAFGALHEGLSLDEVKQQCYSGEILQQRSERSRKRIWASLNHRYFAHGVDWVTSDLVQALAHDRQAFIDLLYLHYCLRDLLAFDLVTKVLWHRVYADRPLVTTEDVRDLLDKASDDQPQIARWSEATRAKLANSILTALRDFGVLEGKLKKHLVRRPLSQFAAEHLLRLLVCEGERGLSVIVDPTWRLFLLSKQDVCGKLASLAQNGRIRFEKAGSTVVLETPSKWEVAT